MTCPTCGEFDIDKIHGPIDAFKVWNLIKDDWWVAPSGKNMWQTARDAKNAVVFHEGSKGQKYKDISYRLKVIRCLCIVFREVE